MTGTEPAAKQNIVVFNAAERPYTTRDVMDAALFRGEIEPIWRELLRAVECEKYATEHDLEMEDSALDDAADAFRYQYDLITAEETEQWLSTRGLTMEDFGEFFSRRYWADNLKGKVQEEEIEITTASPELRELLVEELIFGGEFERAATRLSWRVAAGREAEETAVDEEGLAAERKRFFSRTELEEADLARWLEGLGRDAAWFEQTLADEASYRARSAALMTPEAQQDEIATLRLPLTRFDAEVIEFDSDDAAREALLCVRADGMEMTEVAAEGGYHYRKQELILEEIDQEWQQPYLSVTPGAILGPIPLGEGFELCRVVSKREPDISDPAVRVRVEQRILARHFSELSANHVQWRILLGSLE